MIRAILGVWFAAAAFAQAPIFIVDAASGPGTSFTDIQAAVIAVPDGSILQVRAGLYSPVAITGKGLTILCDPGVAASGGFFSPFLSIVGTSPAQRVVVIGLRQAVAGRGFQIYLAAGPVLLDGLGSAIVAQGLPPAVCYIEQSAHVVVRGYDIQWRTNVLTSDASFAQCSLLGTSVVFPSILPGPQAALTVTNSRVHLTNVNATGGNAPFLLLPVTGAAAIELTNSTVRVAGSSANTLAGGVTLGAGPVPPISGTGTARVDPAVVLVGPPVTGGVATTITDLANVTSQDGGLGGTLLATRTSTANAFWFLFAGWPVPAVAVPWPLDTLWLDPTSAFLAGSGAGPSPTGTTVALPVPTLPALYGLHLVWQSLELTPAMFALSNPSPAIVR